MNNKRSVLLIFIIACLLSLISCAKGDANMSPIYNYMAPTPSGLVFEITSKGTYIRWNDVSNGLYNVSYEIRMEISDGRVITDNSSLPVYEFSNYLRDKSITITFSVLTRAINDVGEMIYNQPSMKSGTIDYIYEANTTNFQVAPCVSNVKIDMDTFELSWLGNSDSTKYNIKITRTYKDGTITSRITNVIVIPTSEALYHTSLASYKVIGVDKYEIIIQACGIKDGSQGTIYYHSSTWSDVLLINNKEGA